MKLVPCNKHSFYSTAFLSKADVQRLIDKMLHHFFAHVRYDDGKGIPPDPPILIMISPKLRDGGQIESTKCCISGWVWCASVFILELGG